MPWKVCAEKIVLDLETKKSFGEVGRQNLKLLGVSVVGIFSYRDRRFQVFPENAVKEVSPFLKRAELIIGFNIKGFDYPVLQPYLDFNLNKLPTLDILEEIQGSLGFRISLNNVAQATLRIGKKGSGLDALRYFRQGQMERLAEYCRHDVFVTREIYEYGRTKGQLFYACGNSTETIPASWAECPSPEANLKEAYQKRRRIEIEYAGRENFGRQPSRRRIDIYDFEPGRVIAYCHLRKAMRVFNQRRILSVKLTKSRYRIPADFNLRDFKTRQKFVRQKRGR